jgi:hypothetical protein
MSNRAHDNESKEVIEMSTRTTVIDHGASLRRIAAGEALLMDARTAAEKLCISERSLWSLSNRGDVRSVRIGKRRLYDPHDLTAFINRQKTPDPATLAL